MLPRRTIGDLHAVQLIRPPPKPVRWMARTARVVTGGAHLLHCATLGAPKARSFPTGVPDRPVLKHQDAMLDQLANPWRHAAMDSLRVT